MVIFLATSFSPLKKDITLNEIISDCKEQIDDFFNDLCQSDEIDYRGLMGKHGINEEVLMNCARWSPDKYTRICLNRTENLELILLCWDKGQETPIHNHDGKACWVHVISGELTECLYSSELPTMLTSTRVLTEGSYTFLTDDIATHCLQNTSGERAITLHLYANPIDECQRFVENTNKTETSYMSYDFDFRNSNY